MEGSKAGFSLHHCPNRVCPVCFPCTDHNVDSNSDDPEGRHHRFRDVSSSSNELVKLEGG